MYNIYYIFSPFYLSILIVSRQLYYILTTNKSIDVNMDTLISN